MVSGMDVGGKWSIARSVVMGAREKSNEKQGIPYPAIRQKARWSRYEGGRHKGCYG